MHKKQLFLCTKNNFSSHINTNKKLHLAALMSVVFLCVYTFLFLNPLPAYMDNTKATPAITSSELNVTTSDISIDTSIDSPTGTFRESSPANISVTTDNYSGYTLSIDSSLDNEYANKLVNSNETAVINSISSVSTESDFTSNTWGIKPSKLEGDDNTNFIPAPSSNNTVTIDTTSGSSIEPTVYTMSIAAKVDYSLPADTYSNTYVVIAVGNPTLYTIEYDKNVDGDVSNMPATQASDTEDASITLSSTTPTSAKKYKFLSWCDGTVIDHDGIPECTGTVYNPGDEYDLDQTTDNHVVLYGMWDRTATLLEGGSFRYRVSNIANNNYSYIVAIKSADSLPEDFVPTTNNIVSTNDSPVIYAWWDNTDNAKTIYIYTDAGRIKTNEDCSSMFGYGYFYSLRDISGITEWDTSNTKNMDMMFAKTNLVNIDMLATGQRSGKSYVSWDVSNVTSMKQMFSEAAALANVSGATDWNVSKVTNMYEMFRSTKLSNIDDLSKWNTHSLQNMASLFDRVTTLENIDGALDWDTSNVTNMNRLFFNDTALNDISGATNWDTSNVRNMESMFYRTKIKDIDALSTGIREGKDYVSWDVSNVRSMYSMFIVAASLTNIDGAINWNTSNVTNMQEMFYGAASLTNIDGAINWNTSNVTNMALMFREATSLKNVNGAIDWDVSNVTLMNDRYAAGNQRGMFGGCTNLKDISGLSNWDISGVEDLSQMFRNTGITNLDALSTGTREGKDYVSWDVSNATNMDSMFSGTSLTDISGIANWNTSNVLSMNGMFTNSRINKLDALSTKTIEGNNYVSWDVSNVKEMRGMFNNDSLLTDISGISNWNTTSLTDIGSMFGNTGVTNLNALATGVREGNDYTSWDVSNVVNMSYVFSLDYYLTDISGITNWNTSKAENMSGMFRYTKITGIDALSTGVREGNNYTSWDVSNVQNMSSMFQNATSLSGISGATNWNTSSVTNMSNMFQDTTSLINVDGATNWNTSSVANMSYMFYGATSLSNISGVTNWNTANVTDMSNMFRGSGIASTTALATGQRTGNTYVSWDVSNTINMSTMFYNCRSLTDSDDLDPLNSWTVNASLNKTDMFKNIPSNVLLPTWY